MCIAPRVQWGQSGCMLGLHLSLSLRIFTILWASSWINALVSCNLIALIIFLSFIGSPPVKNPGEEDKDKGNVQKSTNGKENLVKNCAYHNI